MMTVGFTVRASSFTVRRLRMKLMADPRISGTIRLVVKAKAWKRGRVRRKLSSWVTGSPKASKQPNASLQKFRWVSSAPLGFPVVPEVKMIEATSCAVGPWVAYQGWSAGRSGSQSVA